MVNVSKCRQYTKHWSYGYMNTSPIKKHYIRPHQCDKGGQIAIAAPEPFRQKTLSQPKFGRIFHCVSWCLMGLKRCTRRCSSIEDGIGKWPGFREPYQNFRWSVFVSLQIKRRFGSFFGNLFCKQAQRCPINIQRFLVSLAEKCDPCVGEKWPKIYP